MMKYIKIKNLSKSYIKNFSDLINLILIILFKKNKLFNKHSALNKINLEINTGERVGIIGENGAGKTTLLRIISGILKPTQGYIETNGNINSILNLGIGLNENLTGRENIYLDFSIKGYSKKNIDNYVKKIIDFAELGNFIDMPLKTYSTGMKSRLSFSIVTQIEPDILVIDEALSVGDASFAQKAENRIKELCFKGSIVLIVSHNLQNIKDICNRCIWLKNGELFNDGPPDKIIDLYKKQTKLENYKLLINSYKNKIFSKTYINNFNIGELKFKSSGEEGYIFESGKNLSIDCNFDKISTVTLGKFTIACERIDGIIIFEEEIFINKEKLKEIQQLNLKYKKFRISSGYYLFKLYLYDINNLLIAQTNSMLEVISKSSKFKGGQSVLTNVGKISVTKI
jgi:lipopolysaccharide transport system ATP-binding protein